MKPFVFWELINQISHYVRVVVAERLRRLTRNQLGSARVGSNPADDAVLKFEDFILIIIHHSVASRMVFFLNVNRLANIFLSNSQRL